MCKMFRSLSLVLFVMIGLATYNNICAQDEDAHIIKKIHNEALSNGHAYPWLHTLCTKHAGRIAGSDA